VALAFLPPRQHGLRLALKWPRAVRARMGAHAQPAGWLGWGLSLAWAGAGTAPACSRVWGLVACPFSHLWCRQDLCTTVLSAGLPCPSDSDSGVTVAAAPCRLQLGRLVWRCWASPGFQPLGVGGEALGGRVAAGLGGWAAASASPPLVIPSGSRPVPAPPCGPCCVLVFCLPDTLVVRSVCRTLYWRRRLLVVLPAQG